MHDPFKFHIPNQNHQPSIQEEQYHQPNITNDITNNHNETDEYIMNALFDNPEEEIILMKMKLMKMNWMMTMKMKRT